MPAWRDNSTHTDLIQSHDKSSLTSFNPIEPSISALRLSLGSNVISDVCNIFQSLSEHSKLTSITGRDWEVISRLLHTHIMPLSASDHIPPVIERMAIHAAVEGHILGLKTLMLRHLHQNNINQVSSLFDSYFSLCESTAMSKVEASKLLKDGANREDTDRPVLVSEPANFKIDHSGMSDLFLIVVAAYATQDLWQKALSRLLSMPTTVRLTPYKVKLLCNEHLKGNATMVAKVQLWAEDLVICRLVFRSASLHLYLEALAKDNEIRTILKLYGKIINECRKSDGRLSVKQPTNGRRVVVVSPHTWTYFIQAFFKCSRADLVDRLWKEIAELDVVPHAQMWFAVLNGYARHNRGLFSDVQAVWNRMLNAGVEPDQGAYAAIIHAYFHARRPLEALSLFEQFRSIQRKTSQGRAALHDSSMLQLYNTVLNGFCKNRQEDKARTLVKEMMAFGPQPDIVTYNVFLRYYGRVGDLRRLTEILRALKPAGVDPDNYSFTTVLSALYKAGRKDAHIVILQTMESAGIQPNVAMYTAIINFLVRQGGRANFQNAISLLTKMENEVDTSCRPNEVTYTGLLAGIHRDPSLSETEVKMYSDDLFRRMRKTGVNPNRATYHYLIKASLENPEAHGLQLAMAYYHQMQKDKISLNDRTWFILLSGLVRRKESAVAREVLGEMFHSGHQPDDYLSKLVKQLQI